MHNYKAYYYFVIAKEDIVVFYDNYTLRELIKEVFSRVRLWHMILGTVIIVKDNKEMVYEIRVNPHDGAYFYNLKALYGKSYVTKFFSFV